jgi:MoaA/NifB/PqqE/SkfB family radical SAM enzyme
MTPIKIIVIPDSKNLTSKDHFSYLQQTVPQCEIVLFNSLSSALAKLRSFFEKKHYYFFLSESSMDLPVEIFQRMISLLESKGGGWIYDKAVSYPFYTYEWFKDRCIACDEQTLKKFGYERLSEYAAKSGGIPEFQVLPVETPFLYAAQKRYNLRALMPEAVEIEPQSSCNFKCVMCPFHGETQSAMHAFVTREELTLMKVETFERVMAELHDCNPKSMAVIPQGRGEPLGHPRFLDLVKAAHRYPENYVTFSTNGSLLKGKMARGLIEQQVHSVIVSLHAATPETAEKVKMGDLGNVEANIRNFIKLKKEMGSKLPELRLKFVDLPENRHEFMMYLNRWLSPDIQTVSMCKRDEYNPEYNNCWTYEDYFDFPITVEDRLPCSIPNYALLIRADGAVRFCYGTHDPDFILGYVGDKHMREYLYSEKRLELLNRCNDLTDQPNPCKHCELWTGNTRAQGARHGLQTVEGLSMLTFKYNGNS